MASRYVLGTACLLFAACHAVADPPGPAGLQIAEDPSTCLRWQTAVDALTASDTTASVDILAGAEAQALLDVLNSLPPASHVGGDHVAAVVKAHDDSLLFVVGERGCATAVVRVPANTIKHGQGIET
jgi:hypothetical protein